MNLRRATPRLLARALPLAAAALALPSGGVSGAFGQAESKVTLRFALSKGQVERFLATNKITASQSGSPSATMDQTVASEVKVVSANAGKFGIEYRITDLRVVGADPAVAAMLDRMSGSLKGTRMSLTLDALGATSEMKVFAAGSAAEASLLRTLLQSLGSSQAGFLGLTYPKHPVARGESWSAQLNVERSFREMGVDTTTMKGKSIPVRYTLRSLQGSGPGRSATIEFALKGNVEVTRMASGQPQTLRQSIEATGTARVLLSTGMPIEIVGQNKVVTSSRGVTQTQTMKTSLKRQR